MLRLRGISAVAATTAAGTFARLASAGAPLPASSPLFFTVCHTRPLAAVNTLKTSTRFFSAKSRCFQAPSHNQHLYLYNRADSDRTVAGTPPSSTAASPASTMRFLRGARLSSYVTPLAAPGTAHSMQVRFARTRDNDPSGAAKGEETNKAGSGDNADGEGQARAEGEKASEENASEETSGPKAKGQQKAKAKANKKTFMDHVRGLRDDYAKFPDIYNSANAINFVVFTVFCLCSTGSNTEEDWWMRQWGVDNSLRPWTWFLHSFLTNNFLSITYAMMLLHTMCHHVLPTLGSRGLMLYCGSTAVLSGAVMWLGNWLYYGSGERAPEKQFGPWDIVSALFVMEYFYYGLTPFTILNSFHGWIKYAVWVGEVCILYFDWQPTVVGTVVGLALCKGVPRFKAMKPAAATGGK